MTANQYLDSVLQQYEVPRGPYSSAVQAFGIIRPVIQNWAGALLDSIDYSGSFAKGTGVLGGTDVDIFISLASSTTETLSEIYTMLLKVAQSNYWQPRAQNVSIGVTIQGAKVDLVPGKIQAGYQNYTSLYKNKTNSWTQTNIATHINTVKNSGRIKEIRLAKLWRNRNGLDFPSFYLELAVITALSGKNIGDTANNFWNVLDYFANNLSNARFVDPANTNNVISNDISGNEKAKIALCARASKTKSKWNEIVW